MRNRLVLSLAFGLVTVLPSIALADPPANATNAGEAKNNCLAVGGTYTSLNPPFNNPATCTIVTQDTVNANVPASHPTQAWTVDVEEGTERTEVYHYVGASSPWTTLEDETVTLSQAVTACYNHRGQQLGGDAHLNNPNCQPAE